MGRLGQIFGVRAGSGFPEAKAVLWAAAYRVSEAPLKLLLDRGCDPSCRGEGVIKGCSPALAAARAKRWGHVKLLMERRAGFEKCLFHMASIADEVEIIKILRAQGVSVDAMEDPSYIPMTSKPPIPKNLMGVQWTALHCAAWQASRRATKTLLQYGAQVNMRTRGKSSSGELTGTISSTPLHLALASPSEHVLEVVNILVEAGAELDARDWQDYAPLHIAARRGKNEAVKYLLNRGANVNISDRTCQKTPLHLALEGASKEYFPVVKTLVERGAQLDVIDRQGYAPLHGAAANANIAAVNYLLHCGANVNAAKGLLTDWEHTNSKGMHLNPTALCTALKSGYNGSHDKYVAKTLCMHGAVVRGGDVEGLDNLGLGSDADMLRYWRSLTKRQQYRQLHPDLIRRL